MAARLPNFLIVGAMKSGTTALAHYLAEHPDVHVPPEKEAHFFERDNFHSTRRKSKKILRPLIITAHIPVKTAASVA